MPPRPETAATEIANGRTALPRQTRKRRNPEWEASAAARRSRN